MKLILNIDDEVVKHMQEYSKFHNIELNKLLEGLFIRHIQLPTFYYHQLENKEDFNEFMKLLEHHLNEFANDLRALAKTEEAFETDEAMAKVFEELANRHIKQGFIITELYKTYRKEMNSAKL